MSFQQQFLKQYVIPNISESGSKEHLHTSTKSSGKKKKRSSPTKSSLSQIYRSSVIRKYKRQRFRGMNTVRKKTKRLMKHGLYSNNGQHHAHFPNSHFSEKEDVLSKHDNLLHRVNSHHVVNNSALNGTNLCTDLISEIGGELSGNRGNGNSPFNSSNSCGSPECLTTNCYNSHNQSNGFGQGALTNDMCKCEDGLIDKNCKQCSLNQEQNNNTNSNYVCVDRKDEQSSTSSKDEDYIDVVSMDSEEEQKTTLDSQQFSDNSAVFDVDIEDCLDSECQKMGSKTNINDPHIQQSKSANLETFSCQSSQKNSSSTVNWQQQFMSFLSTTAEDEIVSCPRQCNTSSSRSSSPRKRSRRVRHSTCPCCLGGSSSHGKRQKHHSKHGLSREHKHFIRDMVQLVSLRNKIITLFCSIFPHCHEIIESLNPDSEKVDLFIDHIIGILEGPDDFNQYSHLEFSTDKMQNSLPLGDLGSFATDVNECPSLEGPIDDTYETKGLEEMPVLDICYQREDPPKHCESVSKDFTKIKEISKDENICVLENSKSKDMETLCQTGPCNSKNKMTSEEVPFNRLHSSDSHHRGFSEGDSGIFHETNACDGVDDCWLPKYQSNLSKNCLVGASLLTTENLEKSVLVQSKGDSNTTELSDNDHSKRKDSGCPNDDKFSDVSDDDTIVSDTVYPTLIDMTKEEYPGEDLDIVQGPLNYPAETNVTRVTHDPAYSDISEASRISCSSPNQWMLNSEDPLISGCSDKWPNGGTKIPPLLLEGGRIPFTDWSAKSLSTKTSIRHDHLNQGFEPNSFAATTLNETFPKSNEESKNENIVEIFDSNVELCRKPKLCLKSLRKRSCKLLRLLVPDIRLRNTYFRNADHLEYLLDAMLSSNLDSH